VNTIPALLDNAVVQAGSRVWLRYEDSTYTFEDAHRRIARFAGALAELGVGRGTNVLATAQNAPEYLFTWLALMRLGAVFIAVNPKGTIDELAGLVDQVRPPLMVTDTDLFESVRKAAEMLDSQPRIVLVNDLASGVGDEIFSSAARPDDVAVMIPTSGTTGRSKLVMQTQRAYAMAGEGFPFWLGLTEEDRLMTSLPLFHVNAPAYSVLGSIAARAGLVLLPRFSGSRFIEWARRYGATEFNAIGAMIEILMRQPEREDDSDNPLRLCYTGPSPPKERQLEIERRFGFQIVCGYALSESPYGLIWKKGTRPYETLGSPRQHPQLGEINFARATHEERVLNPGEVGELELRNPAVMLGYYDMPEETRAVLSDDGWLRTGDLVRVNEDGTYTFVGRKKEIIRRRGENMSPVEVESALEAHPAVLEAAVIGVPSELSEEEVKAFIVPAKDADTSLVDLRDFVAESLAAFKVPRYFEIIDELPHTPTGRIAKHELPTHRTESEHDLISQTTTSAQSDGERP
jgi:carnitine-CoA ligase